MSSVSMSGGCSAALLSNLQQSRAAESNRSQQLFGKLDTNGDGTIDSTELKSFTDYIGQKTGTTIDADSLLTALDSDGNGSISSSELSANGRTLFDQLRQQLSGAQAAAGAQQPDPDKPSAQSASHHHGHHGMGHMLASLIDQYGSSSSTADTASDPALSVAA